MNLKTKIFNCSLLVSCFAAASAFAQDTSDSVSVEQKQQSFLEKLEDIQRNTLGFSVGGSVKAGYLRSSVDSDALLDDTQKAEAQAYTHANLLFSIRPSKETQAKFGIRVHEDWDNAHRQGNNVPLIDWWSYDGLILNRHVDFNLGTMRVSYTPLTIYQPTPDYIMEPEILREHREAVMEERSLDGSNRRLMQGLNAAYHSYKVGAMDDIYAQGTVARLRNNGKKADQLFFDFDDTDRYLTAARLGVDAYGVTVGVNDVYVFDRIRSTRATLMTNRYPIEYEKNNVFSGELGYRDGDANANGLYYGAKAEVGVSRWSRSKEELDSVIVKRLAVYTDSIYNPDGTAGLGAYLFEQDSLTLVNKKTNLSRLNNKLGVHIDADVGYRTPAWNVSGKINGMVVDKGFQSEAAMSPISMGLTSVLNSNSGYAQDNSTMGALLQTARSGSLENIYFSMYESVPLAAYNMMLDETSCAMQVVNGEKICVQSADFELFNNYKYGQFYRNGYSHKTMKRKELLAMSKAYDPSVNMALPFGYATPNRKGGDLDLTFEWNDAVTVRALGGYYSADELAGDSLYFGSGSSYLRLGGGVHVAVGNLLKWDRVLNVSASYEQVKEEGFLERQKSAITAGLDADVYGPVAFLAGLHYLKADFGQPYGGFITGADEMLVLGGPKVKIAAGAYLTVQYGLMKNSLDYEVVKKKKDIESKSLEISKNIVMADVKVNF
ncbi:MAG: hypothetical protein IJ896_00535 [Fibrobacter sp.]|nr:hypothetical protein [Fibrobacter sp.]